MSPSSPEASERSGCSHTASTAGTAFSTTSLSNEKKSLEQVAEAFQTLLYKKDMVQDRRKTSALKMKTCRQAFRGSDAVAVILQVLREQEQSEVEQGATVVTATVSDRELALQVGRQMAKDFHLFQAATTTGTTAAAPFSSSTKEVLLLLEDEDQKIYQFRNNLPSRVKAVQQQYPSHWDKMRLLEEHVEVKDRRHMFRVFPQCFVAQEAVDVLMRLQLVRSRKEGVHLIRKLNQKVFCCQHVCSSDHPKFTDEYLFFEFVPKQERMPEPVAKAAAIKRKTKKSKKTKKDRPRKSKSDVVGASPMTVMSTKSSRVDPKARAKDVRNRLEEFRQQRAAMAAAKASTTF